MSRSVIRAAALALFGCLVLGGGAAWAVTDGEINAGVQFSFSVPGARSLGLGGAFTSVADDATAAFTNPAGLTILSRPEVTLEGKFSDFTTEYTDAGHFLGAPSDCFFLGGQCTDNVAGLQLAENDSDSVGPSFLSFVYPRKSWAVAAYRHELANFETAIETQGAFSDNEFLGAGVVQRLFPIRADMELDIVNYGVSGAYRITDTLSIGAGVSLYDFEIQSTTERFLADVCDENLDVDCPIDAAIPPQPGSFFGPPDFSAGNIVNVQVQAGNDTAVGFNLGLQWRFLPKWNLGATYRSGPEFDYVTTNILGPSQSPIPPPPDPAGTVLARNAATFTVPSVAGLGVSVRPMDALLVSFDYDFVQYSELTDDITSSFFTQSTLTPDELALHDKLTIDDASEIHLGAEYVFLGSTPVALRLGAWLDPDHKISFDGSPTSAVDVLAAAQFVEGDDEVHVSAGVGVVIGKSFQVDAAIDVSNLINVFSVSGVYRF